MLPSLLAGDNITCLSDREVALDAGLSRSTGNFWVLHAKIVFKHGTLFRHAVDVLRMAHEPLTTREVVLAMLQARGLSEPPSYYYTYSTDQQSR
jgi:hypothetical protein